MSAPGRSGLVLLTVSLAGFDPREDMAQTMDIFLSWVLTPAEVDARVSVRGYANGDGSDGGHHVSPLPSDKAIPC
jgi:hypothetical protein